MEKRQLPPPFDRYWVSSDGNVYSAMPGGLKKMAQQDNGRGYMLVHLSGNGKRKAFLVHRLVAHAFLGSPLFWSEGDDEVNHKNGCKSDNRLENLEVVSRKENMSHAVKKGLLTSKHRMKRIVGKNLKTGEVVEFESASEASRRIGVCVACISAAATGRQSMSGGYSWEYVDA